MVHMFAIPKIETPFGEKEPPLLGAADRPDPLLHFGIYHLTVELAACMPSPIKRLHTPITFNMG